MFVRFYMNKIPENQTKLNSSNEFLLDSTKSTSNTKSIEDIQKIAMEQLNKCNPEGAKNILDTYRSISDKSLELEKTKLNTFFYKILAFFFDKYNIDDIEKKYKKLEEDLRHATWRKEPIDFAAKPMSKTEKDASGYYHYEEGVRVYQTPADRMPYDDDL